MEIVLLLIILAFVIIIFSNLNSRSRESQESLYRLHEKINDLKKELDSKFKSEPAIIIKEETKPVAEKPFVEDVKITPTFEKSLEHKVEAEVKPVEQIPTFHPIIEQVKQSEPKKSWFESFKENNPDLEKFIGENLINKIGILILVLGVSFFVKFAIDKNWINETARVGIGILCGSLVMAVAHKLKKEYASFSSVIVAGAISIFYFTIAIGFHDYHLFSQSVAFGIMVVITAFSSFVSVAYNRQELAVLFLIGGFTVPFMVSTGEGNYIVLFSYITILNIGILAIAYFKKWNLLSVLSFLFTAILFISWYTTELFADKLPHKGALIFATLFYFIFSITTLVKNIKNKGEFSIIEYSTITANTFVYFGLGLGIIHNWGIEIKGLFTLSLAVYNLIYAYLIYKKFGLDKKAVYLLVGLVLTFVTLTIPIQFKGNYITLFWSCEAVLLFWMAQKSKIGLFKIGAVIVQFLMTISLVMDWSQKYGSYESKLALILNPIFITGIVSLGSLIATYFILKKENENTEIFKFSFDPVFYRKAVLLLSVFVAYFVGILEVMYQSGEFYSNGYSALSFSVTYHFLFSTLLLYFGTKTKNSFVIKALVLLTAVNIVSYVLKFYRLPSNELLHNLTYEFNSSAAFYFHYVLFACMIYFVVFIFKQSKENVPFEFLKSKAIVWLLSICAIYVLSNELIVHSLFFSDTNEVQKELAKEIVSHPEEYTSGIYEREFFVEEKLSQIKTQVIKIGYPILWGVLSFLFLIVGIKKQWKQLRIIALSVLGLTVLKLFIYDINNVSETGKIIAFILLGVLVLVISFVYQKIKKLVTDESETNVIPDEQIN